MLRTGRQCGRLPHLWAKIGFMQQTSISAKPVRGSCCAASNTVDRSKWVCSCCRSVVNCSVSKPTTCTQAHDLVKDPSTDVCSRPMCHVLCSVSRLINCTAGSRWVKLRSSFVPFAIVLGGAGAGAALQQQQHQRQPGLWCYWLVVWIFTWPATSATRATPSVSMTFRNEPKTS